MAMPMFRPQAGDDINEMLKRLGMASDPGTYTVAEKPRSPEQRLLDISDGPGGSAPALPPSGFPLRGAQDGPDLPPIGATADFGKPLPAPKAEPPQAGPGAFGSLLDQGASFMQQTADNRPSFAPPAGASTPSLPPFTPAVLPDRAPFAPVQVEGAVPHGSFNPGGSNPWDRSMTATTPEQELLLQQQAKYNDVLNMVRPQGTYFPSQVLQPHEIDAIARLGGQQATNLFNARNMTETGEGHDRQLQADTLKANLAAQAQLGAADITGKAHVAGAQAAHNPAAVKAEFANKFLLGGGDPSLLGEGLATLNRHLSPAATGSSVDPSGVKVLDTDPVSGGPQYRAAQTLRSIAPTLGKADASGVFQMDPAATSPQNMAKLAETFNSLPPDAQAAFARKLHTGQYGPVNDYIDAAARHFAQNALMAEPPPIGGDLLPPTQYAIQPEGFASPLVTLNAIPGGNRMAKGAQSVGTWGNLPYNQLTVGGRAIPFAPSSASNDMRATFGMGEGERKLAPDRAGKSAALLRELIALQNQTQGK